MAYRMALSTLPIVLTYAACALAQTAPESQAGKGRASLSADGQASNGVQDIVVTAQRRSENLQRVPIAISAVTSSQLVAKGVTGLADLQVAVPSVSVQNIAGYLGTHIRGVGSIANGPGFENPIAIYVDGVYYANQSFGLAGFNNIERIEVLKGPQGTLFGRNATGGLIQIITKDPGRTFQASGSASVDNYGRTEAKIYAGGPLGDTLSADLAVRYARQDKGWGKNLYNNRDVFTTPADVGIRSKIVWKPGDAKFTLIGDYGYRKDTNSANRAVPGSFVLPGLAAPAVTGWNVDTNVNPYNTSKGGGVSLKGEIDLGFATLSNLAAWRETRFVSAIDFDGSPLDLSGVLIKQRDRQFSNEFQLSSVSTGRLTWVAGIYYFDASGATDPAITVFESANPAFNPSYPLGSAILSGTQGTQAISGYAQGTFKITDKLNITGGVRYSSERRTLENGRVDAGLLLPGNPVINLVPPIQQRRRFSRPSFRVALDYRLTNDILLYASVNTGFKSGGFNVTIPTAPAYLPERLTAYEIGEKADLFDRRIRLNTSLFYYDYRDLQVQIPQSVGTGFTNAPKSKIYGADVDLTLIPTHGLEITASTTLLNSRFEDFPNAPISARNAGEPVVLGNVVGNRLAYTPKVVYNLSGSYTIPINKNELVLNASWLHSSSFFFEPDNVVRQDAYDRFNGSVSYRIDDGRYYITAFGTNLTKKLVRSIVLSSPAGPRFEYLEAPRTYGIRLGFNF